VTLTLTSDDLESLINLNKYHYLVCGYIVFDCGRMDGRTDIFTGLLGHLSGDDLINWEQKLADFSVKYTTAYTVV